VSQVEDADRKILARVHHEAVVLPPSATSFVLITGDLDFNTAVSSARAASLYFSCIPR